MLEMLAKQSPSALVGFLIGLFFVWWISPTNNGGAILIVVICVAISIILGMILRYISSRIAEGKGGSEPSEKKIWLPGDD